LGKRKTSRKKKNVPLAKQIGEVRVEKETRCGEKGLAKERRGRHVARKRTEEKARFARDIQGERREHSSRGGRALFEKELWKKRKVAVFYRLQTTQKKKIGDADKEAPSSVRPREEGRPGGKDSPGASPEN